MAHSDPLADVVLWTATGAAAFVAFVVVHDVGHFAAARLIGVPAYDVAVRLREWPAHVALRSDDGQWWGPGSEGYEAAYARHDPQLRWLGAFVAAGFVFQAAVLVVAVSTLAWLGPDDVGARLVRISAVLNGLYLVVDLIGSVAARSPTGDMSSLLRHARVTGVATFGLLVGSHVAGAAVAA